MSAGDRDTLTTEERAALETWNREGLYACPHDGDRCPTPKACLDKYGLFAEVESIVAARVRAAQTQAWEESCRDHYGDGHYSGLDSCPRNPYRLGDTDG